MRLTDRKGNKRIDHNRINPSRPADVLSGAGLDGFLLDKEWSRIADMLLVEHHELWKRLEAEGR